MQRPTAVYQLCQILIKWMFACSVSVIWRLPRNTSSYIFAQVFGPCYLISYLFCLCWSRRVCFFCLPSLALLATLFQLILPCLVCCEEGNCVWLLVIIALCVFLCFSCFFLFVYYYSNLASVKGFKHPVQDPIVCTCRVLCVSTVFLVVYVVFYDSVTVH